MQLYIEAESSEREMVRAAKYIDNKQKYIHAFISNNFLLRRITWIQFNIYYFRIDLHILVDDEKTMVRTKNRTDFIFSLRKTYYLMIPTGFYFALWLDH